jgi:hypothetical protein
MMSGFLAWRKTGIAAPPYCNISLLQHHLETDGILRKFDPQRGVSLAALSYEYPARLRVPEHARVGSAHYDHIGSGSSPPSRFLHKHRQPPREGLVNP